MKHLTEGRHLADRRTPTDGGRVRHFLRIARSGRETWHRPVVKSGNAGLQQFLRIERGHLA